jgi:hypothetical protein
MNTEFQEEPTPNQHSRKKNQEKATPNQNKCTKFSLESVSRRIKSFPYRYSRKKSFLSSLSNGKKDSIVNHGSEVRASTFALENYHATDHYPSRKRDSRKSKQKYEAKDLLNVPPFSFYIEDLDSNSMSKDHNLSRVRMLDDEDNAMVYAQLQIKRGKADVVYQKNDRRLNLDAESTCRENTGRQSSKIDNYCTTPCST